MTEKLNSMPTYQRRAPRYPHNLSQPFTISHSTGMELPVYFHMLHSGDELHFNGAFSSRFNPLIKPFIGDVDIHVDYFFVPLSVIYTPTTSIFYQTDDLISSSIDRDSLVKDRFPVYDIDATIREMGADSYGFDGTQTKTVGNETVSYPTNVFDCRGKALIRLCDLLQYSVTPVFQPDLVENPRTTPWFLCAYQAIHELWYRNDDRERKSYIFNLDRFHDEDEPFTLPALLRLNYVSSYKDFFNAIKVSPVGSSVSMLNGNQSWEMLSKVNSFLYNNERYLRSNELGEMPTAISDSDAVSVSHNLDGSEGYNVNAANIRQLFMVDKLLRITGRANKDYESQFLAHFGIKIPHDDLHNITHIGHDVATIGTKPVISQSDTWNGESGSSLGEIGGQGFVQYVGKQRHFTAPFHGVFMAIMYALPKFRYYGGISPLHNLSDPMKFWQPEYDKRGMEPMFQYYVDREYQWGLSERRLGWMFGYEPFKRKYPRVSMAFRNVNTSTVTNEYAPWVLSRRPFRLPFNDVSLCTGEPVTPTTDLTANYLAFLSTPHDLDTVMLKTYESGWIEGLQMVNVQELFVTDPLITDFNMNMKVVNQMSEYSEPEID